MYTHHVLVARSGHPGVSNVVSALGSMPDVRVIGTPRCLAETAAIAEQQQPRLIIAPDTIDEERAIPFMLRLRPHVPATRFLVVCDDYRPDELLLISEAGIACFLYWSDLLADLTENLRVAISGNRVLLSNNLAPHTWRLNATGRRGMVRCWTSVTGRSPCYGATSKG